jgi:hypothetical protein
MALKFLNDGYFAGTVGIGTSINGGDVAVNNGNSFIVGAAITGNTQIGELGADSGQLQLLTESTRDIKFGSTTYGNIMFLEGSNGNVGIGTTSPDSLLHVSADVSSAAVTKTGTITIEGRPYGLLGDNIATIDFHNNGNKRSDIRMERGNAADDSQLVFSTSDTGTLTDRLIINEESSKRWNYNSSRWFFYSFCCFWQ